MIANNMQTIARFLIDLKFNNNRDWFNTNKESYIQAKALFESFVSQLIQGIKLLDVDVNVEDFKTCNFRIYRDARFSKNKQPYKEHFGTFISKDGRKSGNAGYYIHLEPDNLFMGAGLYSPSSERLRVIRQKIFSDPQRFESIVESSAFRNEFGELLGDKLKTAPKGFSKDFEYIRFLRHKHFFIRKSIEESFWEQDNPVEAILDAFSRLVPMVQYLNRA